MKNNNKLKFVIASPPQRCSGGSIALHALCKGLMDAGYDAKIYIYRWRNFNYAGNVAKSVNIIWWIISNIIEMLISIWGAISGFFRIELGSKITIESVKGCKRYLKNHVDDNTIVVYPESLHGNPLKARKVVHWLLYYYNPPKEGCNKEDLFIAYREQFNNEKFNPEGYTVTVSHFDLDLYKRTNFGEREGKCYIIRKGRDRDDLPKEFDGPIIDDLPEPEKVVCFNRCKFCISYDLQTSYSGIAAMCGCISVVVPEPGKSKTDYRKPGDGTDGIAFGFSEEEISHAVATRENVLERYKASNESGKQNAKRFAEICEEYFFGKKTDGNMGKSK